MLLRRCWESLWSAQTLLASDRKVLSNDAIIYYCLLCGKPLHLGPVLAAFGFEVIGAKGMRVGVLGVVTRGG